jgi:hypothetical protein
MPIKSRAVKLLLGLGLATAVFSSGCVKSPPSITANAESPGELSGDFRALLDRNLTAAQMSFHGVRLGDPESATLALPGAYRSRNSLVCIDAWHAAFLIDGGTVAEIHFADPQLSKLFDLHQPDDVQMRLGKADSADANMNSGSFTYYNRHLRVDCDAPEVGSNVLWVGVTLVR